MEEKTKMLNNFPLFQENTELYVQMVIVLANIFENILAVFLFNIKNKYKKGFIWKDAIAITCIILLSFPIAYCRYSIPNVLLRGLFYSTIELSYSFVLIYLTYDNKGFQFLQTFCSTSATLIFAARFISALLNLAGNDTTQTMSFFYIENGFLSWSVYYLEHAVIYVLFGFFFMPKEDEVLSKKGKRNLIILTILSLAITEYGYCFIGGHEAEDNVLLGLVKLLTCFLALIVLFVRKGIFTSSRNEMEMEMMNELFTKEKEHFEKSRGNIDLINSKCHDLRKKLSVLEGKVSDEEIASLKEATRIYDSTIKTGNDILDAILYEYQLLAEKNGIRISSMCNGTLLDFMDSSELYMLFSNLLSNSFRALENEEKENKIVDLTLSSIKGLTVLEIDNYCHKMVKFDKNGLPLSDKTDGQNHGFGSRSVGFIIKKYNGEIKYFQENDVFKVVISF